MSDSSYFSCTRKITCYKAHIKVIEDSINDKKEEFLKATENIGARLSIEIALNVWLKHAQLANHYFNHIRCFRVL